MKQDNTFAIAITGGIASGKSMICAQLEEAGFSVFYADKIAHEVLTKKEVINAIISRISKDVLESGKISRKKLGRVVFADSNKLKILNSIVHPIVIEKQREIIRNSSEKVIFFEIPLLFESNSKSDFDLSIHISVEKDIQIKRIIQRDKCTKEEAKRKVSSQLSDKEKVMLADLIICNNLSPRNLREKIIKLIKLIKI